nr:hypothetical protein [Desulfobulbaceae bacterium]
MTDTNQTNSVSSICFGLNREIDEASLRALCQRFCRQSLLTTLIPRLSDQELNDLADSIFSAMRKHLSKEEYHALFLNDYREKIDIIQGDNHVEHN